MQPCPPTSQEIVFSIQKRGVGRDCICSKIQLTLVTLNPVAQHMERNKISPELS